MNSIKTIRRLGFLCVLLVIVVVGVSYTLGDDEEKRVGDGFIHAHGLAVDISDDSKLYVATHHGLFVLQDGKNSQRIGSGNDDYMGFSLHPLEANVFYTSGHPEQGGNLGFQKSEDGGLTWHKISDGLNGPVDFHSMAVSPVNPNRIYGWYKGIFQRSNDGGIVWEQGVITAPPFALIADSREQDTVYALTEQGILISKDGGMSWAPLPGGFGVDIQAFSVHPADNKKMLAYSLTKGLAVSTNGGVSWQNIPEQFNKEPVLHIAFNKKNPLTIYILTESGAVYRSDDGGNQWKEYFSNK